MIQRQYIFMNDSGWKHHLSGIVHVFILLLATLHCHSQEGFNITYDTGRSLRMLQIDFNKNSELIVNGIYHNDISELQNIFSMTIDTTGQITKMVEISGSQHQSHLTMNDKTNFLFRDDSSMVIPFAFFHRNTTGLAIVNSSGEIESIQEYSNDPDFTRIPYDIVQLEDGYLITGIYSGPPDFKINAFVIKTDKNGNKLWDKEYGTSQFDEGARTITVIDSNFILLSGVQYNHEAGSDFSLGWVVAIDSMGEKIWEWTAPMQEIPHSGIYDLKYDAENNEIKYFTYFERETFLPDKDYLVSVPVFVIRDTMMNLLSYQSYEPYAIGHYTGVLEYSKDGGWIGAGNTSAHTDSFAPPYYSASGNVVKLSNDGTMEWEVTDTAFYHQEIGSESYLSAITESPSGSIYAVGWANNYDEDQNYRSFGWLIKISPDGCIDTICTTQSLLDQIEKQKHNISLYPNPASTYISVDLQGLSQKDFYLDLYDLTGKLKLHQLITTDLQSVSIAMLDSGLFGWRLSDFKGYTQASGKIVIEK